MNLNITIISEELDDEDLQELTRDVCMKINMELDVNSQLMTLPSAKGARSIGLESIGSIIIPLSMDVLETASFHLFAVTFVAILGSLLKRDKAIKFKIKCEDSEVLILKDNLNPDQLEKTYELIRALLGASK
jgi:hypothetical protein